MPNTIVGLLIFILLLTPGFVYLLASERGPSPVRELSVLRETATVGLGSAVQPGCSHCLRSLRVAAPGVTPDVGELIRTGESYAQDNYLALACGD